MSRTLVGVERAYYEAAVRKDGAAIEALISDKFHFTRPLDNSIDRNAYVQRCWPNSESFVAFDLISVVADDDKVFVTYEAATADGSRFRNTEILRISNEQVTEVEVYFGWSLPHRAPPGTFAASNP